MLDAQTLHRLAFIPTGTGAHGFAVNGDATELYVSNRLAGSISVIELRDPQGREDLERRRLAGHAAGLPRWLPVVGLSNRYGTTVSVIDTHNGHTVLHHIEVGPEPARAHVFPAAGVNYSLGHNGVYR